MNLNHRAVTVEVGCQHADFAFDQVQVVAAALRAAADHTIAAAIEAGRRAERQMHVQRQRGRNGLLIGLVHLLQQRSRANLPGEFQGGGVGGVARRPQLGLAQVLAQRPGWRRNRLQMMSVVHG